MTNPRAKDPPTSPATKIVASVWFTWALLFVGLGVLVAVRRLSGAYSAPPSSAALAGWSIFVAGSAGALRWILWAVLAAAWSPARYYAVMGGLSAALLLWVVGLTIAGAPIAGVALLWALAAAEEGVAWPLLARRRIARQADAPLPPPASGTEDRGPSLPPARSGGSDEQSDRGRRDGPASPSPSPPDVILHNNPASPAPRGPGDSVESPEDGSPAWADACERAESSDVVQQLTRTKSADGPETIVGWLRLPLAAGQRSGVLHVAFCPPLEGPPIIEFEQVEGPPARIKLAQAYAYGARFDVKLTRPADDEGDLVVQFSAAGPR